MCPYATGMLGKELNVVYTEVSKDQRIIQYYIIS